MPGTQGSFLIDVRFAKSDAPPKVALAHPNTVVAPDDPQAPAIEPFRADLRAALEAALVVAPGGPEVTVDTRTYQQAVLVQPSQACRNGLAGLEHGLEVPLDVSVPGRKGVPVRVKLLLESERHPFPGWVVIDFGTSNSTVSVHDPHSIDPPAGLPAEQQRFLRDGFKAWFDANNKEGFRGGRGFDSEWRRYYQELNNLTHPHGVDGCLASGDSEKFYDLLAKVEDGLPGREVAFRRVLQRDIQQIYHQALRVPTLEKYNLYPITLDRTEGTPTLLSEMEIIGVREVSKSFSLLDVAMGSTVRQTRRQTIAKAGGSGLKGVLSLFHPSPKRYFGTDRPAFTVEVGGKQHVVSVDDLMLAGWRHMLDLADEARDKREDGLRSNGPFRKVILTYPTVAPPSVRNRIQGLIRRLGISDVRTDYDEAVAVAIFYLMREYSSVTEMGLESFKARCRVRDDNSWVQNVLVFDIGGGTTDVALIRLTVRDVPVFEANEPVEERGAGGRFYRVEPQLLSSTGDMQLGGELMTLRVFRLLKASLADTLLSMAQSRRISSDSLNRILAGNIPPQFQEKQQGKFKPGSLRKFFEQEAPELADTGRWQEAKDLANRVLPTRWGEEGDNRAARLQAFDTLWKMAEAAKIQLGRRQANPAEPRAPYIADDRDVRQLVETCCKDLSPSPAEALKGVSLELHAEQLEVTIGKVVKEAVMLAMGTLEHLDAEEKVDWLILSGQSCNLELVDKEIRRQFAASDKFVWNPERVTFEKDYAKLATSIGACFAEEYRRRNVQPKAFRDKLRQGLNFLEYSINNLFSTLPCYFELRLPAGATKPLFRAGLELCEIDSAPDHDEDHRAKARSGWLDSAMQMTVMRQDYKHGPDKKPGKMNRWGDFAAQPLADALKMTPAYFQTNVKVKFEVDHKLDMEVLVCRFEDGQTEPDYQARAAEAQYNIAAPIAALGRPRTPTSAPAGKTPAPAPAPVATHPAPPSSTPPVNCSGTSPPAPPTPPGISPCSEPTRCSTPGSTRTSRAAHPCGACSAPRESTASGSPPTESSICTAGRRGRTAGRGSPRSPSRATNRCSGRFTASR